MTQKELNARIRTDGERAGLLETLAFAEKRAEEAEWRLTQGPHALTCDYGSIECTCYKAGKVPFKPSYFDQITTRSITEIPAKTYTSKLFSVPCGAEILKLSGTLDGFIDLATANATYPLTIDEAKALRVALSGAIADVETKCLYDSDALLEKVKEIK